MHHWQGGHMMSNSGPLATQLKVNSRSFPLVMIRGLSMSMQQPFSLCTSCQQTLASTFAGQGNITSKLRGLDITVVILAITEIRCRVQETAIRIRSGNFHLGKQILNRLQDASD